MRRNILYSGRLQQIVAAFVVISTIWVFYHLIGRSIGLDEGMLLKSIVESDNWSNYIHPLAYYDQAQPMLVSLFHHFIVHNISLELEAIRIATLIVSMAISAPILYIFFKEKTGALFPALLFLGFSFSIGFYFTEIKHYAFEIAASFWMLSVFYLYLTNALRFSASIILISLATLPGFSTLIPAFVLIAFTSLTEFQKDTRVFFNTKNLVSLLVAGTVGFAIFLHMQYLTVYQMNNYDAYLSKGLLNDLILLIFVSISMYGKLLSSALALMISVGLLSERKSLFFKITLVFIIICGLILIGKLTGLYPVASDRHLIWVTPFSFVLLLVGMTYLFNQKGALNTLILSFMIIVLTLQPLKILYDTATGKSPEWTNNNGLYATLSKLPASNVVVFPRTQPTLQYYMLLSKDLEKHNYIGFLENLSTVKDPNTANQRLIAHIDSTFEDLPKGKFYYALSHQVPLFTHGIPARLNWRGEYVESKLKQYECSHTELFRGRQVQLLELECEATQ